MTDSVQIANIVRRALEEDIGQGDVTSAWTLPPGLVGRGMFLSKASTRSAMSPSASENDSPSS